MPPPLIEDVVEESSSEEDEGEETATADPPVTGRGRVLRRATSSEPARPMRAAVTKKVVEARRRLCAR